MNVVEKNEGLKVDYKISGNKINFADELTLNLEKYERDFPVHIDICEDEYGCMICGTGRRYVAQVDIPARSYETEEAEPGEDGMSEQIMEPVAFDISRCVLTLWGLFAEERAVD